MFLSSTKSIQKQVTIFLFYMIVEMQALAEGFLILFFQGS